MLPPSGFIFAVECMNNYKLCQRLDEATRACYAAANPSKHNINGMLLL